MRLLGKTALITGAASGIGHAAAVLFKAEGANLFRADISDATDRYDLRLDVADEISWEDALSQIPHLDIVIASAGISFAKPILETSLAEWQRVMDVNLNAAFLTVKHCLPLLKNNPNGGSIIFLGSASGTKAAPSASAYSTSKAALRMFAKVAALEAKPHNVRINLVSPGGVATPMWKTMPFFQDLVWQHGSEEAAWQALGGIDPAQHPLHRLAFPEEIAESILYLASDASAAITGAELIIDSGYTL